MKMFETSEIFEPFGCSATPGGKGSNHGSNICEGPDGELIAVWYGGTAEKHEDVQVWMAKKKPGAPWQKPWVAEKEGKTSKIPEEMEEFEGHSSEGNPVIYYEKERGRLHLWWITIWGIGAGRGWSTGFIKYKHSDDAGKSWILKTDGQPRLLNDFWGEMIKNPPIKMSNGDVILPAMAEWTSYSPKYYICKPGEFEKGSIESKWLKIESGGMDCFQPTLAETSPGHVLALMRTGKGGKFSGVMAQMESNDYGRTWTTPFPNRYGFPNPNANNCMTRLTNGHLVLVFNNSPEERNPLTVALSADDGKSFPTVKNLDWERNGEHGRFHYPCVIQASDGTINVTYSNTKSKDGTKISDNIKWACFTEDWIKQ